MAKAAKASGVEAAPTDHRLEGDREALIEQLRAERQQAARDAEAAGDDASPLGFEDPFKH